MTESLWEEIKNHVIRDYEGNSKFTFSEELRERCIKSWIRRFSCQLRRTGALNLSINFNGYEPASFPFVDHICSKPGINTNNEFNVGAIVSKKMCNEFYRNLAQCKRAQLEQCCVQNSGPFVQDTAFRSRRYVTRAVTFAIVERFSEKNNTKILVGEFPVVKIGKNKFCGNVDTFEDGRYTLPKGYQCCIQTHKDANCQKTAYLLAIRAQHNSFNCAVHRNYGVIQARQLIARAKKNFQELSGYLLTDGYFYRFVTVNWSSGNEHEVTFNAETQLDALINYGCKMLENQINQKISKPPSIELPPSIIVEQIINANVVVISMKGLKYAIKCVELRWQKVDEGREMRALKWLKAIDQQCNRIAYPFVVKFDDHSLSISEYGGMSLFEQCYCDANQNQILAKIVKTDVTIALEFLHKNGFVFVDVHPGNIVYNNLLGAKLIDVESISKSNEKDDSAVVIRFFKGPNFNTDKIVPTEDFVSLKLVLHWILNTLQYRDLYYNNGIEETDELLESLLKIEN